MKRKNSIPEQAIQVAETEREMCGPVDTGETLTGHEVKNEENIAVSEGEIRCESF